jgi:hypothetical protein
MKLQVTKTSRKSNIFQYYRKLRSKEKDPDYLSPVFVRDEERAAPFSNGEAC